MLKKFRNMGTKLLNSPRKFYFVSIIKRRKNFVVIKYIFFENFAIIMLNQFCKYFFEKGFFFLIWTNKNPITRDKVNKVLRVSL